MCAFLCIALKVLAKNSGGVGGREVGLKLCDMHGCYVCWRTGVRSWSRWSMVQVAASAKTNRVSTGARQS